MVKSILVRFSFVLALLLSVNKLTAADTTYVAWSQVPGAWESFIMGDTASNGWQNADVYVLEASKVHYQVNILRLYHGCEIRGGDYDESAGGFPATIQQVPGADGSSQFDNWPASNILTYGNGMHYKIHNLLFNGAMGDESGTTFGVMATYGENNKIVVDHVTSVHNGVITYFNFGKNEHWTLTNNTAVQYSCYPAGMYFGGFFWGGGSWGGTLRSLYAANNTIEGAHANPFVIWTGPGSGTAGADVMHITHNTFVNTIDNVRFVRDGNNAHFTNNLYVNSMSQGQTRNAGNTSIALNSPGGHGKMTTKYQWECADSTMLANGTCWDNNARNIHFENNAWFDTQELLDLMAWNGDDGWCWALQGADGTDSTDADGNVVQLCDTMLAVSAQSRWMDDSTTAQMANGVSETNNIHADDLGWALDPAYINAQILRSKDWLDNGKHDTYTTHFWMHQADDSHILVEWPLPMDFSYSTTSAAYTHASGGFPVGNLNVFPDKKAEWLAQLSTDTEGSTLNPTEFTLSQNYPNPFNPSTEISFTLYQSDNVELSIYNMLGQKVRTLTNEIKNAGTHTLKWNGLDEMGQSVSTGIYLYRLTSGTKSITKKMALMK